MYGVSRAMPGKKPNVLYNASQVAKRVAETVRYDKVGHGIADAPSRVRCAFCSSQTTKWCTKCRVNLHQKCFNAFHGLL